MIHILHTLKGISLTTTLTHDHQWLYSCYQASSVIIRASHLTWVSILNYLKTPLSKTFRRCGQVLTTIPCYKPIMTFKSPCLVGGTTHLCFLTSTPFIKWLSKQCMSMHYFIILVLEIYLLSYTTTKQTCI